MEFDKVNVNVSKLQGDIGHARAVYEYTKLGYTVLAPLSDSSKYDLVIDDGTQLLKVQVKTSRCSPGPGRLGYAVNLVTSGGNTKTNTRRGRQPGDYDILFVLVETGDCWSIPTAALGDAKNTVHVGSPNNPRFDQYKL